MKARLSALLLVCLAACGTGTPPRTPESSPETPPAKEAAPAPRDAAAIFARFKEATGGARWDRVSSLESRGTLVAGGMSGTITLLEDTRTGRTVSRYTLGPVQGADGYDGTRGWTQDPGGEVSVLDAPEARERAVTQAWFHALGYYYPERAPATLGTPTIHDEGGARFHFVEVTPKGGKMIALWFAADTGLLARSIERRQGDTITTEFAAYRDIEPGVRVPFELREDTTDAAGRTDPRQRVALRFERVTANVAIADAQFAMPVMSATARIDAASGTTRIPFELINNHIYATIQIDGKEARVLVDTGGVNLLTPKAAARLGIEGSGKLAARGVGDEQVDLALARVGEVQLGAAHLTDTVFYVIDLGDLPKVEGLEMDGLVGYEMFRRFRVSIDYRGKVLTLTDPAKFTPPPKAHVLPFELADRIPIVNGVLDGLALRISIDTGSRSSLTLHAPLVREHGLVERYAAAPETVVGWGVGGPSLGRPARFGTLVLGDLRIQDIAGDLYVGDKGAFANPDLGGNLGGGILRRFQVSFDYDAHVMYLAPHADTQVPDDFDRSGMWLLAGDGLLEVGAVAASGPAERAGLRKGDRITRIGADKVQKRSLNDWRIRLRSLRAGTRLAITFQRDTAPAMTTELELADAIPAHAIITP